MKIDASSIEEYFANCGDKEESIRLLDKFIVNHAKGIDRKLYKGKSVNLLGYGYIKYNFASGEIGEWPTISIAAQKNYISLYICAVVDNNYVAETNKSKLGKVNVGKSCIRFKKFTDINTQTLKDIIDQSVKWYKRQPKLNQSPKIAK